MTAFGMDKFYDALVSTQPSGRVGTPEDFAGLILFICGRGGAHMTGNAFVIDGGQLLTGYKGKPDADDDEDEAAKAKL